MREQFLCLHVGLGHAGCAMSVLGESAGKHCRSAAHSARHCRKSKNPMQRKSKPMLAVVSDQISL